MCGGHFAFVWGGELSNKNKHKLKYVVALDGHKTTLKNTTTNQKQAASTEDRWDLTSEQRGVQGERDSIVLGVIELGGGVET